MNDSAFRTTTSTVTDGTAGVDLTIGGAEHDATLVSGTWDDGVWEYSLELGATDLDQEITVTASDAAGNFTVRPHRVERDATPPCELLEPPSHLHRAGEGEQCNAVVRGESLGVGGCARHDRELTVW